NFATASPPVTCYECSWGARLIREAKLFSEKSSQENRIFIDCSAESTKGRGGTDFDRRQVMVSAPNSRLRETANGERRTANGERGRSRSNPQTLPRYPRSMLNFPGPTKRMIIRMQSISIGRE